MFLEAIAAASSLADAYGQFNQDKRDVRNYNKQIRAEIDATQKTRNQLGIDTRQAQDWATMQIAKSQNNPNVMNSIAGAYGSQVNTAMNNDQQAANRITELRGKIIDTPKFNFASLLPAMGASAIAANKLFGGKGGLGEKVDGKISSLFKQDKKTEPSLIDTLDKDLFKFDNKRNNLYNPYYDGGINV